MRDPGTNRPLTESYYPEIRIEYRQYRSIFETNTEVAFIMLNHATITSVSLLNFSQHDKSSEPHRNPDIT